MSPCLPSYKIQFKSVYLLLRLFTSVLTKNVLNFSSEELYNSLSSLGKLNDD